MVIWKTMPVMIKVKMQHLRKMGKGKLANSHIMDNGEVPVAVFNEITNLMMGVDNNRGTAYACRNRLRYRKRKTT